jgi:hypothetical protein
MSDPKKEESPTFSEKPVTGTLSKFYWIHALRSGVYLLVMIWLAAVWIYSSAYMQTSKSSHIRMILSDLDGGAIGTNLNRKHIFLLQSQYTYKADTKTRLVFLL